MPRYSYTALTASGEEVAATAQALSLPALAADLAQRDMQIRTVRTLEPDAPVIRGIPYFDVLAIYRQIASAIEAGMPLKESLGMLSGESRGFKLKALVRHLETQVGEGVALSEAMKQFPQVFPSAHLAVVRAGEESEQLGSVLGELADQAESLANMSRRFASSLVYPAVIAFAALLLLNFGMLFVVPQFAQLFVDLGIKDLPLPTQVVLFIGKWIAPATLLVLVAAAVMLTVILTQRKAASGRMWLDSWKLRLPLIGQIVEKAALARFACAMGVLLRSGIELPRALDIAAEGVGNGTVERIIKNVAVDVEKGLTLSESIDLHQAMPPTMAWRIGVAEEGGALDEALGRIGRMYANQVDNLATTLAGVIEPLLITFVGSGVMMLVLGMFLPLIAVIQNLCGVS